MVFRGKPKQELNAALSIVGADSASVRVLQQIHEQCQRAMLIMATRPIKDYNVTFLKDFQAYGSYKEIALNGLSADEIGEIILQTLQTAVHRVSPQIVRVIQVNKIKRMRFVEFSHIFYT